MKKEMAELHLGKFGYYDFLLVSFETRDGKSCNNLLVV